MGMVDNAALYHGIHIFDNPVVSEVCGKLAFSYKSSIKKLFPYFSYVDDKEFNLDEAMSFSNSVKKTIFSSVSKNSIFSYLNFDSSMFSMFLNVTDGSIPFESPYETGYAFSSKRRIVRSKLTSFYSFPSMYCRALFGSSSSLFSEGISGEAFISFLDAEAFNDIYLYKDITDEALSNRNNIWLHIELGYGIYADILFNKDTRKIVFANSRYKNSKITSNGCIVNGSFRSMCNNIINTFYFVMGALDSMYDGIEFEQLIVHPYSNINADYVSLVCLNDINSNPYVSFNGLNRNSSFDCKAVENNLAYSICLNSQVGL